MVHWSIIATLVMYKRGMTDKIIYNPVTNAFTYNPATAFAYLDKIYLDTEEEQHAFMAA